MTPPPENGESERPETEAGVIPEGLGAPAAFVIPRELAQATLNYLAAQPYREVYALVQAFEALEPARPDSGVNGDSPPLS
jgi:hypothetical protein